MGVSCRVEVKEKIPGGEVVRKVGGWGIERIILIDIEITRNYDNSRCRVTMMRELKYSRNER